MVVSTVKASAEKLDAERYHFFLNGFPVFSGIVLPPPISLVVFTISSWSVKMYLVLYRDANISSIITAASADTDEATIPMIPIGVKSAA